MKQSHKLIVVTSRSKTKSTDTIIDDTIKWINNNFPNTFSRIYFAYNHFIQGEDKKTKEEICFDLNVDILIEDNLEHAKNCASKGIKVLLFDAPWNKSESLPKEITRVKSWDEIIYFIKHFK